MCASARILTNAHTTHEQANDNHCGFSGNRSLSLSVSIIYYMCARRIVMHNTVFISLYHSICVHSCSSFSFLCLPTYHRRRRHRRLPTFRPTRSSFFILHLPIEDHGQTSSSLSIVCILREKKKNKIEKKNRNESLVRSYTAARTRTAFSHNFIAFTCD